MTAGVRTGQGGGTDEGTGHRRVRRWSIGHLAVALAAILAFVANVAFLRARDDVSTVVATARDISAGEAITPADLTTVELRADPAVLETLLTSSDAAAGSVARRPFSEGDLVGASDLLAAPAPDGLASMSIPVETARAAGGEIRVGDRVDLVDVGGDGQASYVVRDVPVLTVAGRDGGVLGAGGSSHIVLGVDEGEVLAIAEAIADGKVDVVVTTGARR